MADGAFDAREPALGTCVVTVALTDARPSSVADVVSAVRDAGAAATALRIVGRGSWLDAGRPVRAHARLHTEALSGIVEYTPGDLTLTARAGTRLSEIARVTAAEGQWLPLAPYGGDEGSLGATIATASAGPLAHAMGLPRDTVLGVEFVSGSGDVVRGGGRVVKNVAGFDLTRLIVGSWGTLGVITELTVRLRARPEWDETIVLPCGDGQGELATLLARVRDAAVAPISLELVDAAVARALGVASSPALLVRLAGNEQMVLAQRKEFEQLGAAARVDGAVWNSLRVAEPVGAVVCRVSGAPSHLPELWRRLSRIVGEGRLSASVQRGVARLATDAAGARAAAAATGADFTIIYERLPAPLWAELARGAAESRLSRGVRLAFDPRGVLNPGILGEESS